MAKYHAIVFNALFPAGEVIDLHSTHRTQAAAARALSKGISGARKPGRGWVTWCAVVTPDNRVLSLRQAQGRMPGEITWESLRGAMREIAARPV